MAQSLFVIELPNSQEGENKRIEVGLKSFCFSIVGILALVLFSGGLAAQYLGVLTSPSAAPQYAKLRAEFDHLRTRYSGLQRVARQHNEQIASLQHLANEVSVAYGITQPELGNDGLSLAYSDTAPSVKETFAEYNFLKSASFSRIYHQYAYRWQVHGVPDLWPVKGVIRSGFGGRSDPFSGEGAFHTGVDLAVVKGTPVHTTADGVVTTASWHTGYGNLVVVDHGNGFQTYYGHLSKILVIPGEEVRLGQVVALSGSTGRSTGPHVHYEVRLHGVPVNPYNYMARTHNVQMAQSTMSDFGL
jgi:murein DD-endopeptidase MepM/ murein hydrolase activator NlpD